MVNRIDFHWFQYVSSPFSAHPHASSSRMQYPNVPPLTETIYNSSPSLSPMPLIESALNLVEGHILSLGDGFRDFWLLFAASCSIPQSVATPHNAIASSSYTHNHNSTNPPSYNSVPITLTVASRKARTRCSHVMRSPFSERACTPRWTQDRRKAVMRLPGTGEEGKEANRCPRVITLEPL